MKIFTKTSLMVLLPLLLMHVGAQAQSLFNLLSKKKSGIDFVNEVRDEKDRNILLYSNYYGGAGVGVGDFNRDGLPDLFFAGNLSADRLYINEGELHFKDITEKAGIEDNGGWSSGVVVADVNQDGWPDIFVTRELYDDKPELRKNKLYINNGDLTFTESAEEYGLEDDERTRHATFFDYDKDGDLDAFLLNQPPNPGNYSELNGIDLLQEQWSPRLYRNNGPGQKFTDVTKEAGMLRPGFPNSAITCDFDKDGWPDLYVANDFNAPDFLYMNNGDGTFEEIVPKGFGHTSFYSMGVDAADINNDTWPDLMVLDMVAEDNFRLKANMSGMDPSAFWKVVEEGGHFQYMYNTLQLNHGNRHFSEIGQMAGISSTDWSWANLIADFDNDGLKDIFVTNGLLRDIRNSDAAKTFPQYVTKQINEYIMANPNDPNVTILDILNLDEALDLLPSQPLTNYMYRNLGDLRFEKVIKDWGLDEKTFSNGAAYADLDSDGDLDLIISNVNERAYIYENQVANASGNHFLRVMVKDGAKEHLFGVGIEIEVGGGKQYVELTNIRGIYSTSENVAHFGLGNSTKVDKLRIHWTDGTVTEKTDVAVDQVVMIDKEQEQAVAFQPVQPQPLYQAVQANGQEAFTHRENIFDDFEKQVLLPHKMSQFGPALAVADANGDGLDDYFVGGAAGQEGQLFLQQLDGEFIPQSIEPKTDKVCEDVSAAFFDADGDGDQDLYVASGGNAHPENNALYQDRLYFNDGTGKLTRKSDALPSFAVSSGRVRPHDFDGDGDMDVFVAGRHKPHQYPMPVSSFLLENDGGTFRDVTADKASILQEVGMVTDAVWVDTDGDGQDELVLAGEWMSPRVLKEVGGKWQDITEASGLSGMSGWWFSITKGDLDGDGDMDLVAGNLGLNYKYQTSSEEPFDVYYYDFDNNGSKDIVLGYYNNGTHYPLRGRSCSSQQVPELKKKFETYNLFAAAELEEVYGEDKLENALHYKAETFATTVFENLGNGQFRALPLPREAQVSTVNDFLIRDVDGDGLKDIILAGNLYVAEVETPRSDAGIGLMLKNKGNMQFEALPVQESGIFLPYDVKQLSWIGLGKERLPAVLSAANNGPVTLLKPRSESPTRGK